MTAIWPPDLPEHPLVDGYEESFPDTLIRTEMEAGVSKVRRRFTAAAASVTLQWHMSGPQVTLLEEFHSDVLLGGALRFTMPHPRTQLPREWRMVDPPSIRAHRSGVDLWIVTTKLELMP